MLAWLQSSIDDQHNEIAALDAELAAVAQEEAALRLQVESTVSEKQKLADRLAEVDALLHAVTPCDELSVQDLRSQYELQVPSKAGASPVSPRTPSPSSFAAIDLVRCI